MPEFPATTATILVNGYPREGIFVDKVKRGRGLYYFPGDFIAGDSFELWLTPDEAKDEVQLLAMFTEHERARRREHPTTDMN